MENSNILVKNLVNEFNTKLSGFYHRDEIRQMLYMLFEEYMEWPKTKVHLLYGTKIPEDKLALFTRALDDLCTGKPVQYILGKTWFNGILLTVDAAVLVPRQETEELCAMIGTRLKDNQTLNFSILDIGTGSGCISIDLKKRFPEATITGIDSSRSALEIAWKNARDNECVMEFIQSDILSNEDRMKLGRFNVIVSNPPYVLESEKTLMHLNVTGYEPSQALYVPDEDPLKFYSAIADFACSHLVRPGHLFFEINERFGEEICNLVRSSGFSCVEVLRDVHGKNRFVSALLA